MKVTCAEAEKYMEKAFKGSKDKKELRIIKKHCKKCEICKVKFYNFRHTNINFDDERLQQLIIENRQVDKRRKILKFVITLVSVIVALSILYASFYAVTMRGKNVFFASLDYGESANYTERTSEHPSRSDVENAFNLGKEYFGLIGRGGILTSMKYNDELSFKRRFENTIVIDFSYYRMYAVDGSSGKTNFTNSDYSFLVTYSNSQKEWYIYGAAKISKKAD